MTDPTPGRPADPPLEDTDPQGESMAWFLDHPPTTADAVTPPAGAPAAPPPPGAWGARPAVPVPPSGASADTAPLPAGPGAFPAYDHPGQAPPPGPTVDQGPVPPPARRRGPGWLSVLGIGAVAALLAGLVGGGVGAYLANSGRLGFGSTAYEAPTPTGTAVARPPGSIAAIAANALPSVVTIQVSGRTGGDTGSGWVFDDQGHIVTNNHVIEAAAGSGTIVVELSSGKKVPATIVGRDLSYDLAVIKVTGVPLKPLPLGTSADVVVGDAVIAVGAPLGLESTVTSGIVSALNRPVSPGGASGQSFIDAIQTDAAINPGNSGGPLLDMQGRVIGVTSAIARIPGADTSAQSGNIGVGFAIPSDQVRKTAEQLIRTGKAEHPVIGVYLDQSYTGEGVKIASAPVDGKPAVDPKGPAAAAGLQAGDVILAFDGRPMGTDDELVVAIRARDVGDDVTLKVRRAGKEFDVRMRLKAGTQ
ncbi:MAG: trypsin-like peptidase domain-containing protein [Nostocoides sp.]